MSAFYHRIRALQSPFPAGVDAEGRSLCIFNVMIDKAASETLLEELVGVLELAGVGTRGVNLFGGSMAALPAGAGPFLTLRDTGGSGPTNYQNSPLAAIEHPNVQITVHAATYVSARSMARAALTALTAIVNQTLS